MPTCELRYRNVAFCNNETTEGEYYQVFTTHTWSCSAGSSLGIPMTGIRTVTTGPEKVFICNKCLAASIMKPIVSRAWHLGHVLLIYFVGLLVITPLGVRGLMNVLGIWDNSPAYVRFIFAGLIIALISGIAFVWGRHMVRRSRGWRSLLESIDSGDKNAIDPVLAAHHEEITETGDLLACAVAIYKNDEEPAVSPSRDQTIPDRAEIGFQTRKGTCWNGQNVTEIKKMLNAEGED